MDRKTLKKLAVNKVVSLLESDSSSSSNEGEESDNCSSSSSDSELELLLKMEMRNHSKIKKYVEITVSLYSESDFKTHFRVERSSVENLMQNIKVQTIETRGRKPVPLLNAVLLTIWTLSNQECFRSIADRFGYSKGHAHTIFINTCKILASKVSQYIKWPRGKEATDCVREFEELRGESSFPGVFGCVDGTHIPIPGPENDNSYYNRKGYHSILLQGICNSRQEFINVYCGWPGSTHDARLWQNSTVYKKLNDNMADLLPTNTYLLGDTAYPLRPFIMVPFKDNGHLNRQQKTFNKKLSSTRVVIEQTFGRLKGMFRRLKYLNVTKIEYSKLIILSCCILHNISIRDGSNYTNLEEDTEETNFDNDLEPRPGNEKDILGTTLRNEIMNRIC